MDNKFVINDFEGPLDLLLHLIKISKIFENYKEEISSRGIYLYVKTKDENKVIQKNFVSLIS